MARTKQVLTGKSGKRLRVKTLVQNAKDVQAKRPHRYRAGTQSMRKMMRLKNRDAEKDLIPLAAIKRVVRGVLMGTEVQRIGKSAAEYIRRVVEGVCMRIVADAMDRCDDGRKVTLRRVHIERAVRKWMVDHRLWATQ